MRSQQIIYIQNENSAVRNKDILNVNMSSDICVFNAPSYNIDGASKIDCNSISASTYIVPLTGTQISVLFEFTGNTYSFYSNYTVFKYEIYKYYPQNNSFITPPVYKSPYIHYYDLDEFNNIIQNIPVNNLLLDGEYIIKGFYESNICTDFMSKLGARFDTLKNRSGSEYGLYNGSLDYYFIAIREAETPQFIGTSSNTPAASQLHQQVIIPENGQVNVTITNNYSGTFIVTLNGLVLAPTYDYTFTGSVITFNESLLNTDILTIFYVTTGGNNLIGDNIYVNTFISSGTTNNEGSNVVYFNTDTSKYELYTSVIPSDGGKILVMINGVTLANGIDYYQSITNPKRIILEGDIVLNDLITIVFFPKTNVVNGLNTNAPIVTWTVQNAPQTNNGLFTLEVSTGSSFNSFYYTGTTNYVVGTSVYNKQFTASGSFGDKFYYRVKNEKKYVTLCGDIITSTKYSEIIPITIQTNSINSY